MEEQTDTTVTIEADAPATIFEDISLAIDNWLETKSSAWLTRKSI